MRKSFRDLLVQHELHVHNSTHRLQQHLEGLLGSAAAKLPKSGLLSQSCTGQSSPPPLGNDEVLQEFSPSCEDEEACKYEEASEEEEDCENKKLLMKQASQ